jgi:hypothetical protein
VEGKTSSMNGRRRVRGAGRYAAGGAAWGRAREKSDGSRDSRRVQRARKMLN